MGTKHKTRAIVLGMSVNGLGVSRALGRNGVSVIGVSNGLPGQMAVHSRHVDQVWECSGDGDAMVDMLLNRGDEFSNKPVLFPIADDSVRCVARRLEELNVYYVIGMPEAESVNEMMSKRGFATQCEQLDLPVPKTAFVDHPDQIHRVAQAAVYPSVLKPEFRSPAYSEITGQKVFMVNSADEVEEKYNTFCHVEPRAVLQQWIPGTDHDVYFCLQYYNRQSKPMVSFCGRKIRQYPPEYGSTASCEPVDAPETEELTTRYFSELGFRGLCSMEFKRNIDNGRFLMVEPTVARTDWQSALADANGVFITYVAYCDLAGEPPPRIKRSRRSVKWVALAFRQAVGQPLHEKERAHASRMAVVDPAASELVGGLHVRPRTLRVGLGATPAPASSARSSDNTP